MYYMVNHCVDKKEQSIVTKNFKFVVARLSNTNWDFSEYSSLTEVADYCRKHDQIDMACIDIAEKNSLSFLESFRKKYEKSALMLIADLSISPIEYMKPSIMASSLILHPVTEEAASKAINTFVADFVGKLNEKSFEVSTKEGTQYIPLKSILYFEARDKKVYIITDTTEIGFYSTIDEIATSLEEQFVRSHRSFVVNKYRIEKVSVSENLIYMNDGTVVPLSRGYKPNFKKNKKS